jgi:hypothetical protein
MSGKRERGISYGTTVKLNDVNDSVCGGATSQGTGATLYGGILGIEIEFTDDEVYYDSAIGTLYGGVYKYVQTLSTGGAGVRGQIAFWSNQDTFLVTATNGGAAVGDGNQAGIFLNAVTAGNYCWIQVGGIASVLFNGTQAQATPSIKDYVVVKSGQPTANAIADGTAITASLLKCELGIAKTAPVASAISLVELLDRFSSPDK